MIIRPEAIISFFSHGYLNLKNLLRRIVAQGSSGAFLSLKSSVTNKVEQGYKLRKDGASLTHKLIKLKYMHINKQIQKRYTEVIEKKISFFTNKNVRSNSNFLFSVSS